MVWLTPKCPVRADEQVWIEESMDWLVTEFGSDVLRGTVVLPTPEFFPDDYTGSAEDVQAVLVRICGYMDVDPARIEFEFADGGDDAELLAHLPSYQKASNFAAGHYQRRGDKAVITIDSAQAQQPTALVATIAHEIGHERLLGEDRISASRKDHEPLTDLLTVFFGFGIFTANSAFEFSQHSGGWSRQSLGYLTELMYGYALALYAWRRDEPNPDWAPYLDTNPQTYMKKGLRYLKHIS